MPQCSYSERNRRCENHAKLRVWCPTWVGAHEGPAFKCAEHARVFQTEHNNYANDGQFFWGDDADAAFQSVEAFILRSDPRYGNTKGMLANHGEIPPGITTKAVIVVDGKAWLYTYHMISRLGDWLEARERFHKLFKETRYAGI